AARPEWATDPGWAAELGNGIHPFPGTGLSGSSTYSLIVRLVEVRPVGRLSPILPFQRQPAVVGDMAELLVSVSPRTCPDHAPRLATADTGGISPLRELPFGKRQRGHHVADRRRGASSDRGGVGGVRPGTQLALRNHRSRPVRRA